MLDDAVSALELYPSLNADQAVTLVRAARGYQQALWIADDDPSLAWLYLVGAVESAASHWSTRQSEPVDILRLAHPRVAALIDGGGDEQLLTEVAGLLAPLSRATARFVDFLADFLPPPPSKRPPEYFQVDWSVVSMRRGFRKVYDWRSRALHAGIPFPDPMCWPPMSHGDPPVAAERPAVIAAGGGGGSWLGEDMPLELHVFAHIARAALSSWWTMMARANSPSE